MNCYIQFLCRNQISPQFNLWLPKIGPMPEEEAKFLQGEAEYRCGFPCRIVRTWG